MTCSRHSKCLAISSTPCWMVPLEESQMVLRWLRRKPRYCRLFALVLFSSVFPGGADGSHILVRACADSLSARSQLC